MTSTATLRLRQARLLAAPTARTIAWPALLGGGLVGLVLVVAGRLGSADAAPLARWPGLAALALCLGAAWLLDDAASLTVACTPTPLALRRLMLIALALPLLGGLWAVELWYATGGAGHALFGPAARGALSLEFAAMLTFALAVSALALRVMPESRGGFAGIVAPFALLTLAAALPARWTLLALPGDGAWTASHLRWAAILAVGVLILAWTSREPRPRARAMHGIAASDGRLPPIKTISAKPGAARPGCRTSRPTARGRNRDTK